MTVTAVFGRQRHRAGRRQGDGFSVRLVRRPADPLGRSRVEQVVTVSDALLRVALTADSSAAVEEMLAELKAKLADVERTARVAEGRNDDLAGMVAELNRALGTLCRVLEEDRPGTAARLLAALDEAGEDRVVGYRERVTGTMRSMLGCIQEFLFGHRQVHPSENR